MNQKCRYRSSLFDHVLVTFDSIFIHSARLTSVRDRGRGRERKSLHCGFSDAIRSELQRKHDKAML